MSASLAAGLAQPVPALPATVRVLTEGVLRFVWASGMAAALADRRDTALQEVMTVLGSRLGFALDDPVRARMIRVLFDLLDEVGAVRRRDAAGSSFDLTPLSSGAFRPGVPVDRRPRSGAAWFFGRCLAHAPAFLRGAPPLFGFDRASAPSWVELLASEELARARGILARLVLPRDRRPSDALVLCYGPGLDLVEIEERCPAARVTALDFTDAFREVAERRLGAPERVRWQDPASWGGFGQVLPFGAATFDRVFLTCADPYIRPADRDDVFQDIWRVLRPGGILGLLTHAYPDRQRQAVFDPAVRLDTFCHDFLESVCRGWHGFSDADALRAMFHRAGFQVDLVTHNSSIWRLAKPTPLPSAGDRAAAVGPGAQ